MHAYASIDRVRVPRPSIVSSSPRRRRNDIINSTYIYRLPATAGCHAYINI
jgi:hypothetical protein